MPTYLFSTNPGKDFSQLECVTLVIEDTKWAFYAVFDADVDVEVDFVVDVEADVDFKVWK